VPNNDYEQGDNPANQAPTPFSLFKEVKNQVKQFGIKRLVIDS